MDTFQYTGAMDEPMPSPREVAEAKPAASVILVRDSAPGVEIFMVKRHGKADFASAYVFPGGMLDESDGVPAIAEHCHGLDDETASATLGLESGGLAYWVGAVRECFEESGYVLAYDESGSAPDLRKRDSAERFANHRGTLHRGDVSLESLCRRERLRLALDQLHYCRFFVTPEIARRRYSTRFFVARVPDNQEGVHDGTETVDSLWIRPEEALARYKEHTFVLAPPTVLLLRDISAGKSVRDILAGLSATARGGIVPVMPTAHKEDGRIVLRVPGYPDVFET